MLLMTITNSNAICVFVDKYSKMVHLAPCNKNITAPLFARMFMKEIVRLHGIPKRIISDRDTRFNSIFFRKFTEALDIDLAMSTAFHHKPTAKPNESTAYYKRC